MQSIWTCFLGRLHFFWHEEFGFLPRKDLPQDPILHPLNTLHTEASHSLMEKIQNILVLSWGTLQSNPLERMHLKRTSNFTNVIALYFTAFWPDGRSYELKSDYEPWIQFQVLKIYPSDWVKLWISAGSHQSLSCWGWVEKVRQHYKKIQSVQYNLSHLPALSPNLYPIAIEPGDEDSVGYSTRHLTNVGCH